MKFSTEDGVDHKFNFWDFNVKIFAKICSKEGDTYCFDTYNDLMSTKTDIDYQNLSCNTACGKMWHNYIKKDLIKDIETVNDDYYQRRINEFLNRTDECYGVDDTSFAVTSSSYSLLSTLIMGILITILTLF